MDLLGGKDGHERGGDPLVAGHERAGGGAGLEGLEDQLDQLDERGGIRVGRQPALGLGLLDERDEAGDEHLVVAGDGAADMAVDPGPGPQLGQDARDRVRSEHPPDEGGKSLIGEAWIGWSIEHDPADMLVCQPDRALMQDFVIRRINPLIATLSTLFGGLALGPTDLFAFAAATLVLAAVAAAADVPACPAPGRRQSDRCSASGLERS